MATPSNRTARERRWMWRAVILAILLTSLGCLALILFIPLGGRPAMASFRSPLKADYSVDPRGNWIPVIQLTMITEVIPGQPVQTLIVHLPGGERRSRGERRGEGESCEPRAQGHVDSCPGRATGRGAVERNRRGRSDPMIASSPPAAESLDLVMPPSATERVTAPDSPPPLRPVPLNTAVMSPAPTDCQMSSTPSVPKT